MPRRTHTTPFMLAFGARMRSLRQEQGLSLAQLGKKTGIGKGHLSSIECGFAAITTESIERIAKGLELSPFLLLAFPEEDDLASIVDLVRQIPTTRYRRLRRILKKWTMEGGA
jgi:transcriptional regulator with XRE-family HTH domain